MSALPACRHCTLEQCHALIDSGRLTSEHRVELLRGEFAPMARQNDPHATGTIKLINLFCRLVADKLAEASCQWPLALPETGSEPEPDFMLLRKLPGGADYEEKPHAQDVLLLMEVCDASFPEFTLSAASLLGAKK